MTAEPFKGHDLCCPTGWALGRVPRNPFADLRGPINGHLFTGHEDHKRPGAHWPRFVRFQPIYLRGNSHD